MLDGVLVGFIHPSKAEMLAEQLRMLKLEYAEQSVPSCTEIAAVLPSERGQFPGLYLFTTPARMMRPVTNLRAGKTEMIGTFEQVYMNVALEPKEFVADIHTHMVGGWLCPWVERGVALWTLTRDGSRAPVLGALQDKLSQHCGQHDAF